MFLINSPLGSLAAAQIGYQISDVRYRITIKFSIPKIRNPTSDIRPGQALSQNYGRCFAEFLNEGSLVHLRLLALPTCVGLRYGYYNSNFRGFSGQFIHLNRFCLAASSLNNFLKLAIRICLDHFLKPLTRLP